MTPGEVGTTERRSGLERQARPRARVEDRQDPEPTTASQRVAHEVHAKPVIDPSSSEGPKASSRRKSRRTRIRGQDQLAMRTELALEHVTTAVGSTGE